MSRDTTINAKELAELLTSRDHGDEKRPKVPTWVDPERYPRRAKVADPDALKKIQDMEGLVDQLRALARKAEVLDAKLTIARNELYEQLEQLYPDVLNLRRGGVGLRDWQHSWWYVGWNAQAYGDEQDGGGNGTGVYL